MRQVHQGEFYRHFKDRLYQIVAVAEHSETGEKMVVYQALYGDYRIYVRPYEMFVSEVDHEKYPQAAQRYRFERVEMGTAGDNEPEKETVKDHGGRTNDAANADNADNAGINPILGEFLDAETMQDKMHIMVFYRNQMDEELLNSIAISLDLVLDKKPLQAQYDEIMKCLTMKQKFEYSRNR